MASEQEPKMRFFDLLKSTKHHQYSVIHAMANSKILQVCAPTNLRYLKLSHLLYHRVPISRCAKINCYFVNETFGVMSYLRIVEAQPASNFVHRHISHFTRSCGFQPGKCKDVKVN